MKNDLALDNNLQAVENSQYRKIIYEFFQIIHEMPSILMTITNVRVFKNIATDKIIVEITSHSPGIIIGKAGHFINELILFMQNELEIEDPDLFELKLQEPDLWKNMYQY